MSARDELREYADRYGYTEHVNALLDAFRAEVLREAAGEVDARAESHTVPAVADVLRRMADASDEQAGGTR